MRRKPGDTNRISNLIKRNTAIRFESKPMTCDAEIEIENEDGTKEKRICGSTIFDRKTIYGVVYVPRTISPNGKEQYVPAEQHWFLCMECGKLYKPVDWKQRAKESYEGEEHEEPSRLIVPEDMRPEDNGGTKD